MLTDEGFRDSFPSLGNWLDAFSDGTSWQRTYNYLGKITEGSVVCFPERSSLPTGRAFKKNIPPFSFFDVALTFACFPPLLST